ncbi:hypothetical protein [Pedobacter ureilyticus]|uniref:Uncharacterized protein n=1 Tax=Pedobacter ureilyticus TaxID=1393051 RepID=A0ABW9J408_9SPHI|nr:hypothetical protein [Pedobacter helvus]
MVRPNKDEITFLTSKGVIEISKNGGFDTYSVYLERYYIGSILRSGDFSHQNEDNPIFNKKEKQLLIDIAYKRITPKSLIKPMPLSVNSERWSVERYTKRKYRVKSIQDADVGFIWQEIIKGRLMWVSDRIDAGILSQIAPQMLTLIKKT